MICKFETWEQDELDDLDILITNWNTFLKDKNMQKFIKTKKFARTYQKMQRFMVAINSIYSVNQAQPRRLL